MNRPRLVLWALASLGAVGCSDVLDLRVQVQQLCLVAARETFSRPSSMSSGLFPFPLAASTPVPMDFDKPLAQVPGAAAGLDLDARFDEVVVRSTADLSFIRSMAIDLESGDPAKELPPLRIGEFTRDPSTPRPLHELKVPSRLQVNVFQYLVDEPAHLRFNVVGSLPPDAFTADIEACIFVQAQATY